MSGQRTAEETAVREFELASGEVLDRWAALLGTERQRDDLESDIGLRDRLRGIIWGMKTVSDRQMPVPRWQPTWEAKAEVTPIVHRGSQEACRAWMEAMAGREVLVTDSDGKAHIVGVITRTEARNLL